MSKETIRTSAYLKWEAAGRPEGRSQEFWCEAEREFFSSLKAIYALAEDSDMTLRSRPQEIGVAVTSKEAADRWVAAGEPFTRNYNVYTPKSASRYYVCEKYGVSEFSS